MENIRESEYGVSPNNFHIKRSGNTLTVELTYPDWEDDNSGKVKYVVFDQEAVRASDSIRIHYDYTRDGYVIEQPTKMCWNINEEMDMGWKESVFLPAWNYEKEQKEWEESL